MSVKFSTHPIWSNTEPRTSPVVTATPFLVSQATDSGDQQATSTTASTPNPTPQNTSERKLSDASSSTSQASASSLDRHFLRSRSNVSESTAPQLLSPTSDASPVRSPTSDTPASPTPSSSPAHSSTLPRSKRRSYDVRDVSFPTVRRAPSLTNIPVEHVISPSSGRGRPLSQSVFNLSASVPDISVLDFSDFGGDLSNFTGVAPLRRMSSIDTSIRRRSSTDTEHTVTVVTETRTVTRSPSLSAAASTPDLRRLSTSNLHTSSNLRAFPSYVRRVTENTISHPVSVRPVSLVYDAPGTYIRRVSTEKKTTEKTTTRPSPARSPSLTRDNPVVVRRVVSRSPSLSSDNPVVIRRVISRSPSLSSDNPVFVRRTSTTERRISTPSPVVRRRVSTETSTETKTEKTTTEKTTTRPCVSRRLSSTDGPGSYTRQVTTERRTSGSAPSPTVAVVSNTPGSYIRRESTETKTTERKTSSGAPTTSTVKLVTDSPKAYVHKVVTEKSTSSPLQSEVLVTDRPASYVRRESTETTTTTQKKTTGPAPTTSVKLVTNSPEAYTHKVITEKTSGPVTVVESVSPASFVRRESTQTTTTEKKTTGPVSTTPTMKLVTDSPEAYTHRVITETSRPVTVVESVTPASFVRRESTHTTTEKKTTGPVSTTPMKLVTDSPEAYTHKVVTEKTSGPVTVVESVSPVSFLRRESTQTTTTTEKKTTGPSPTTSVKLVTDSPEAYTHKIITEKTSVPETIVESDSPTSCKPLESTEATPTENTTAPTPSAPSPSDAPVSDSPTPYIHSVTTEKTTSGPSPTEVLVTDSPASLIHRESTKTETIENKTIGSAPTTAVKLITDSPEAYTHKVITETRQSAPLATLTETPTSYIRRVSTETKITEKTTSSSCSAPTVRFHTDVPEEFIHKVITEETNSAPVPTVALVSATPGSYIRKVTTEDRKTFDSSSTPVVKLVTESPVSYIRQVSTESPVSYVHEKTTTIKRTSGPAPVPEFALMTRETPASSIRKVTIEEQSSSSSPTPVVKLVTANPATANPASYIRQVSTEKTEKTTTEKTTTEKRSTSSSAPSVVTRIPASNIISETKTIVEEPGPAHAPSVCLISDSPTCYTRVTTEKTTTHSAPSVTGRPMFVQRVEPKPRFGVPSITITKPESLGGTTPFDMTASVKSPSGLTELCDVVSLDDSHYSIKFVPQEMGVHTVSVKHKDMHIPGSPFEFTVGPIAGGGSHKVHAAGPGLERGEVEVPNEFHIYTREAGAGGLSIAVEGPSKAEIDFQDKKDGSCQVSYKVAEPGEYYVSVKFNDEHIPDSPFRVQISPSIGDARKCSVQSLQEKGLQPNKPAAFVVNFNGAKGRLTARVVSPSGSEEEALVQEIDDGQYAVRFIPRENGVHLVHVLFDNYHIPESPFKICVGKMDADAGKVTASGEGLRQGKTGEVAKFVVNTVNAGSGSLAVTVEGPSKVKLECSEVDDGYEFQYKPTAPGDYFICIKYAGTNIAGSPFKAKIEGVGQPSAMQEHASVVVETVTKTSTTTRFSGIQRFSSDATKVTATGKGLTKAFRGQTATFQVDASQAGNNIMYIGMMGPKGPCDELVVKHQGNLVYKVDYKVKESGRYMLIVRWGDQDIPGSPFAVEVQ